MDNCKTMHFHGGDSKQIEVSWNKPDPENAEFLFMEIESPGDNDRLHMVLSRDATAVLRDHLTFLLGEKENPEKDAPVQPEPDRATKAMEELAFQLDLFSPDDLADALREHSEVLRKVHNL